MKKSITFFSNNFQGGVAVYNDRLVNYINDTSKDKANVVLYNRYPDHFPGPRVVIKKDENRIYSYQKLRNIINDNIVCCSESIELETLNYSKYKGQIIYFLHGDYSYYYNTAKNFESIIDGFACVSELIAEKLSEILPQRVKNIKVIKAILPDSTESSTKKGLIFVGRAEDAKGFNYIPKIYSQLKEKGYKIPLSIYCQEENTLSKNFKQQHPEISIEYGKSNFYVMKALAQASYLIFPSLSEGLPLVVAEAMQQGVIPITSDLPILKIMTEDCGFHFKYNDINSFANTIIKLESNTNLRQKLSQNAQSRVKLLFNSKKTLLNFQGLISIKRKKTFISYKFFCSRLDRPFIPNWLTILLRTPKQ